MARSVVEAGFDAGGDAVAGAADLDFLGRDGVVARTFDDLDRHGLIRHRAKRRLADTVFIDVNIFARGARNAQVDMRDQGVVRFGNMDGKAFRWSAGSAGKHE